MNIRTFLLVQFLVFGFFVSAKDLTNTEQKYAEIQKSLQGGWGTFNHKSVLSHVLMPEGFAMNIGIKIHQNALDNYLKEAFISSRTRAEKITPGYKAFDGSYSELTLEWGGVKCKVESATTEKQDLILLITPIQIPENTTSVVLETAMLWNRSGSLQLNDSIINVKTKNRKLTIRSIGVPVKEFLANSTPYLSLKLNQPVAFYSGEIISMAALKSIVSQRRKELEKGFQKYGKLDSTYQAIQSVIGWNVIFDASKERVIFPVSRIWNDAFAGQSVLFEWDSYFGAWMASFGSKELAYANAVEMTKSITPGGFIPNFSSSYNNASFDRSEPPVGSFIIKKLYEKFHDKWLLEYLFDDLLTWNRWWSTNRDNRGLLCWGSNPVAAPLKGDFATNNWQGAAYESGLDNSPMFDKVPFNSETHLLEQADVGLMSLYVMDCVELSEIAAILGKEKQAAELKARADFYRNNLNQLWDEKAGIYKNKRTDTGELSNRLSPTCFFPMLAKAPSPLQVNQMVKEHLLNPEEFFGEWMMPAIAKNDSAFKDQDYWRGRIWAPLNFLVYQGLLKYNQPEVQKVLVQKSHTLMMENVKLNGYVYENYNAITGNLTDLTEARRMGDCYYHWGALLGFMKLLEAGY